MSIENLTSEVIDYTRKYKGPDKVFPIAVPGLTAICKPEISGFEAYLYTPVVCLILQGAKETLLQNRLFSAEAGQCLIISHHVPVTSRITAASLVAPYTALVLSLDMEILRSLIHEVEPCGAKRAESNAISTVGFDHDLIDAMKRLFALTKRPNQIKVMSPLLTREIHYRLLLADHGGMLRELIDTDSAASRVNRAIEFIQKNYNQSISVPELALANGMSPSSFHEHFKAVTATTPLQYQKEIRLMEAKRLLHEGSQSISSVAVQVGYESPNQFSREFSRKFGASPRNIGNLQNAVG